MSEHPDKLTPEQRALRARVEASHLRDSERWTLSYTEHTATALQRRAAAVSNGKAS